ncbi:hypothetical protein DL96DRAFT_1579513 [Flagelloscypha sp. PMI_526]|nr:hypothetical protein DL96DRAFT_1579513 [Flagelloscypha sp. PMI_526]
MALSRTIALATGLILRFVLVNGQNATIYGVLGEDVTISPLPSVTLVSQSSDYYLYSVLRNTSVLVYHSPGTTQTTTNQVRKYGSTSYLTTKTVRFSDLTPPITTTLHGSTSTIFVTTIPVTTTISTLHATATSPEASTTTIDPQPLIIPYEKPAGPGSEPDTSMFSVSLNGSYVEHEWYRIHDQWFSYNCDLSKAKCSYTRIFGGYPLDNVTYTGKVAPMWVVSNGTQTAGQVNYARPQLMAHWYSSMISGMVIWSLLNLSGMYI